MIAIIDYGVGNLFSLKSSFAAIGEDAVVTSNAEEIESAERIVLPGVGAFGDAARKLRESGLWDVVISQAGSGKPLLGVCVGMQLLFERSFEFGEHEGLGLIPGEIRPIKDVIGEGLKIPQIGWNKLIFRENNSIFKFINDGDHVYFVHSYSAFCKDYIIADTQYGANLTAAVCKDNIYGLQFHPEKSGDVGLNILRGFLNLS